MSKPKKEKGKTLRPEKRRVSRSKLRKDGFNFLKSRPPKESLALLSLVAQLLGRHLAKVKDKNSIDRALDSALAKRPFLKAKLLKKFVSDYQAIPSRLKQQLFGKYATYQLIPVQTQDLRAIWFGESAVLRSVPTRIDSIDPPEPAYGYSLGQLLTINGQGFSSAQGDCKVEIWDPNPVGYRLISTIDPTYHSHQALTFRIPQDINPGVYAVRAVAKDGGHSDYFLIKITAPQIVLSSITPQNQQPGSWILITGERFIPNSFYQIKFQLYDLYEIPPPIEVDAPAQSGTQIQVRLPNTIIPGNHLVQVLKADSYTPPSDWLSYSVGIPKYRVSFTKMKCLDETANWIGNEWGEDEVNTVWAVTADGKVWTKTSGKYDFNEKNKTDQTYNTSDSQVLTPDGQYTEVKYGLAVTTALIETDKDEIQAASGFIGVVVDLADAIAKVLGGGAIPTDAIKIIKEALFAVIKWLFGDDVTVGADPSNPNRPGPITKFWLSTELQQMLLGQNTGTDEMMLDFHGDDDHGWYQVWYKILRG